MEKKTGLIDGDASWRQKYEALLKEYQLLQKPSSNLLELTFLSELSQFGLFIFQDGHFLYQNKMARKLLSVLYDDAATEDCLQLKEQFEQNFSRILTDTPKIEQEFQIAEGKSWQWFHAAFERVQYQGEPAVAGTIFDVSSKQLVVEEKLLVEQQLFRSQKIESLNMLARGVAHEFNNILSGILGYVTLAKAEPGQTNGSPEVFLNIEDLSRRGTRLVSQLLTYSQTDFTALQVTDLNTLLEETLGIFQAKLPSRIMLHHQFRPNLPAIEINVGQLKQVVITFCNEAVQNVPDKGGILTLITGQMIVDAEFCRKFDGFLIPKPGNYVFFEIHDTSPVMTEKEIVHLFDPYFREIGEQGLKLSLALNVIKNNNGFVTVNSLLAAGNSLRVYLPASSKAEVVEPHFFQQALRGVDTILLVDNEQAILKILKTIFSKLGYSVFTANNGQEAVELFEQINDDIDLVLLDLTMPVMNGIEALKKLREIDPAVRVIMFSGYDKSEMDRVPDVQGVEAFIEKPRLIDELNQQIMDLFGRK